ncbi:MAG: class I SAM-dependent methyltransferase [Gammaproteobacteria bacterium]
MESRPSLPEPDADELAHVAAVRARIVEAIDRAGGRLSFADYMDLALYAPGLGYYVAGARSFGRDGDFVTAPELSPLFGATLAQQCAEVLARTGGSILEFGGGSGRLAATLLAELAARGALPDSYCILELSPGLRARQRETIAAGAPEALARVRWLTDAPALPLAGVVIANEVLDALPVRLFARVAGADFERGVTHAASGDLAWTRWPADAALSAAIAQCFAPSPPPADYVSEINLRMRTWLADLPRFLRRGVALLVDYGDTRRERYHAHNDGGSLRCYFRHRVLDDPLRHPGLQDITASVDFTRVAEDACDAGFTVLGYATQASFLLACGIEERLQARLGVPGDHARLALEARILLLPQEMGTRCKVLALGRDYGAPLLGFRLRDERHRL